VVAIHFGVSASVVLMGCHRQEARPSGSIVQRAYLWQRDWTPAVVDAVTQADKEMDGLVILGAEKPVVEPVTLTAMIPRNELA